MAYEWMNKVALVTGGASGIGEGIVRVVLKEGAKHVGILDIDKDSGIALQDELNAQYGTGKAKFLHCDVTNDDQLFEAFSTTIHDAGHIDVVINNAGIANERLHSYKKLIDINLTALVTSTLKAKELMRKDHGGKGGTVINISSIGAITNQIGCMTIYAATKAAILHFSHCFGTEKYYLKTGVRILTVCFGGTETPIINSKKVGSFDQELENEILSLLQVVPLQSVESAASAVSDAYKRGRSGSVWLSTNDKPGEDITDTTILNSVEDVKGNTYRDAILGHLGKRVM